MIPVSYEAFESYRLSDAADLTVRAAGQTNKAGYPNTRIFGVICVSLCFHSFGARDISSARLR